MVSFRNALSQYEALDGLLYRTRIKLISISLHKPFLGFSSCLALNDHLSGNNTSSNSFK